MSDFDNNHRWFVASTTSGTAGNAISFTQAMTLDADGDLGVGVTSPSARLHVASGDANVALIATSRASGAFIQYNLAASGAGLGYLGASSQFMSTGTSSDFGIRAEANLLFSTGGNTERARIDSSGNLLVGTTSLVSGYTTKLTIRNTGTRDWAVGPAGSSTAFHVVSSSGSGGVFLTDTATSWSALSDERLKTSLIPFQNPLEKVCSLRTGTGRYLVDEQNVSRSFLIAQDVQAVLPEAIDVQDDEIGTLGLRYTDTIPLLIAAIQEQQAMIQSLRQRLSAANL